jgi:MFS family permease
MRPKRPSHINAVPPAAKWWVMLGIGLGVLMFTLDTSIVNVALPTLVNVFDTNFSTVQWVVLSYLLVINALVLGAARWGDMIGKKPLYLGGLIVFTISSVLCGLSPSVGWLITFRAMQGAGAVMISALGAAIITEVFPSTERGRALGIIGSVVSLGIALGPTVGGLLLDWSGWRTIFWVNLPVGIFASLVVARSLPSVSEPPARQPFDWWGALLLTAALVMFSLGMTEGQDRGFAQPLSWGFLVTSLVGLLVFLWWETAPCPSPVGAVPVSRWALQPQPADGGAGVCSDCGHDLYSALLPGAGAGLSSPPCGAAAGGVSRAGWLRGTPGGLPVG